MRAIVARVGMVSMGVGHEVDVDGGGSGAEAGDGERDLTLKSVERLSARIGKSPFEMLQRGMCQI